MKPQGPAVKKIGTTQHNKVQSKLPSKNTSNVKASQKLQEKPPQKISKVGIEQKGPSKIGKDSINQEVAEPKIKYKEKKQVPQPQQVLPQQENQQSLFLLNDSNFYLKQSTDGECRYIEFKQQPQMTQQFYYELTCCFPKQPIFVIPAINCTKKA